MIVVIDDSVFARPDDPLGLLAVLQMGEEARHRIQTDPVFDPGNRGAVHAWLERQDPDIRAQVEFALTRGARADSAGALDVEIRIESIEVPNWHADPPRLPLATALEFLRRPLVIKVENQRNDGAFLKRVGLNRWREALAHSLQRGWLRIDHGGGMDEMRVNIESLGASDNDIAECLRSWLLFDSDCREPGVSSQQSESLRQLCMASGIAHHQLERRAIENYLPLPVLFRSADRLAGPARTRRRQATEALQGMPPEQRHCYNMKGGFAQDRGRDGHRPLPSHFGLHAANRHLQDGFGRDISILFGDETIPFEDHWLVNDGQAGETSAIIQAILQRL